MGSKGALQQQMERKEEELEKETGVERLERLAETELERELA